MFIALTTSRDQQNIVNVIYHIVVDRGEYLSKCYTFVCPTCVRGDPVRISKRRLVTENYSAISGDERMSTISYYVKGRFDTIPGRDRQTDNFLNTLLIVNFALRRIV